MNHENKSPKSTEKGKLSVAQTMGYWLSLIILTLVVLSMLIPSAPLFIRLFVPFPKLEEVHYWKGVVDAVSTTKSSKNYWIEYRFFINTESGRHEFSFGYWGRKHTPENPFYIDKSIGEIWYHPLYGTVKYEFKISHGDLLGKTFQGTYEGSLNYYEKFFVDSEYGKNVAIILIAYVLGVYQIIKQKKKKLVEIEKNSLKQSY